MTFSHSYPLYKLEWSKEPSHKLRFLAQSLSVLCSSPTPSHQKYDFAKLIRFLFTFWWWVGSLQFRTTLFIHTASSIPKDSSVLLSSFFTRSNVFAHIPRAQLLFALLSETFLAIRQNSLNVTVCMIARSSCRGYFIHSLSTLHYCNAPSLATRLTGDYRDRTFTGKCGPASLDTRYKKSTFFVKVLIHVSLFYLPYRCNAIPPIDGLWSSSGPNCNFTGKLPVTSQNPPGFWQDTHFVRQNTSC